MPEPAKALDFVRAHRDRFLQEYKDLVAIPSVSTLPEHKPDMHRAAKWMADKMRAIGLNNVEVMPTAGHPVAYGEWLNAPGQLTVLVYGHYDVQPVDPLDEWTSPPFEPTIRGDNLYARGASDMKAADVMVLSAIEALLAAGELGVNVKVLMEGEEEIGSPSLGAFMRAQADKLKCDFSLNCDSGIFSPNLPSLTYGLRGLAYFELWVHGPASDLHSGVFGGSVHNPAQVLCELIAGMHDADGRITLPGFYDEVRKLDDAERAELARLPRTDEEWRATVGAPALFGEKGYTTLERLGARPTLEVNGLLSGFTGAGSKTVLPAKAMAKISMRLVPYQDDRKVEGQLRAYLEAHAPPSVRWELKPLTGGPAVLVNRDSTAMRAAVRALETTFGVPPVYELIGGSVPIVSMVKDTLKADTVLMGFGLKDDNIHAPNEKMHLPNFHRGLETFVRFFANVANGS